MRLVSMILMAACMMLAMSCNKNKDTQTEAKYDWQLIDAAGNETGEEKGLTETEMKAKYPDPCYYYRTDEPKYCWVIGSKYWPNVSEKFVNCFFPTQIKSKVVCNSCGNWYTRKKMTYKPTDSTLYSYPTPIRAYCGDTATTFNADMPFIIKNTADSLILLQYSSDGTVWH